RGRDPAVPRRSGRGAEPAASGRYRLRSSARQCRRYRLDQRARRSDQGAASGDAMRILLIALLPVMTTPAAAQVSDIEVPAIVMETGETSAEQDEAIDLANIVQSAAKGVTTVQEAPAIVTVVTADEIRERQFQDLAQVADNTPGWQRIGLAHSNI